ncbi:GNAT family N-acetyltransferase [Paenibacillus aceris]|uniref:GNAT superfamily N-acetyltransferase n=1 Tax=Paenibacillus aceris TaxID=869555 RepID=A0ABS4I5L7_9BACL|nr:GNAT family N-acetyltransferase [Paenibacillus aceris]MBP1966207.1 GNAT superfamily N-acetyltransferase [Paenibacillus aceris]NHW33360.1 GNAT family N-acetyltransferase [Paenibacillus aceris]
MKRISLTMVRQDLNNIPTFAFPPNYRVRNYKPGEEHIWADIEVSVGEFEDKTAGLKHFDKEFGSFPEDMSARCLFIENEDGKVIGTTTAWYGAFQGEEAWGRIHWVAVHPDYQGQKLAKPLLSAALQILSHYHKKAYLTTQTTSYQAINMYLNYGFEPLITKSDCLEGWRLLEEALHRKMV